MKSGIGLRSFSANRASATPHSWPSPRQSLNLFTHIRRAEFFFNCGDALLFDRKVSLISSEKYENWVNNVSLHLPLNRGGDLWDVSLRCALVLSRLQDDAQGKRSLRISPSYLDGEAQLCLPQFSAEMRRHPSRRVGLQAVGDVPREGQSAHLASRFVGSAPTHVLSEHHCPEKWWKNRADCYDCYTATHAKPNIPQEIEKVLKGVLVKKKKR